MTTITAYLTLVLLGADAACAESARNYADGAAVLRVVQNRATSGWARYDGSLLDALLKPAQHAHGCKWPLTWRHIELGIRFALGRLVTPAFVEGAQFYIGDHDGDLTCADRRAVVVGRIVHTYCAPVRAPGT